MHPKVKSEKILTKMNRNGGSRNILKRVGILY